MIHIKTVINFTDFLDIPSTYKPNYEDGWLKLSDYKYLIAHQIKNHYQVFVGDDLEDDYYKLPSGSQLYIIDIAKNKLL